MTLPSKNGPGIPQGAFFFLKEIVFGRRTLANTWSTTVRTLVDRGLITAKPHPKQDNPQYATRVFVYATEAGTALVRKHSKEQ